jgi:hypothetical protein
LNAREDREPRPHQASVPHVVAAQSANSDGIRVVGGREGTGAAHDVGGGRGDGHPRGAPLAVALLGLPIRLYLTVATPTSTPLLGRPPSAPYPPSQSITVPHQVGCGRRANAKQVFQAFQTLVSSVLSGCCKSKYRMLHML